MSLLPSATYAETTEPLWLASGGVIPGPVTVEGALTVTGTGNAITVPNGSILAAGVQSTAGFTSVVGGFGAPAQFPLGLVTQGTSNLVVGGDTTLLGGAAGVGLTVGQGSAGAERDAVITGRTFANGGVQTSAPSALGSSVFPIQCGLSIFGNLAVAQSAAGGGDAGFSGTVVANTLRGRDQVRSVVTDVSPAVADVAIPFDGTANLVTGLIQGAGPSFTVAILLPADIGNNPAYRGMTIAECIISIPSTTRTVVISARDSNNVQLLSTTLASLSNEVVTLKLGAPGDATNPLGLYLTTITAANMVTI